MRFRKNTKNPRQGETKIIIEEKSVNQIQLLEVFRKHIDSELPFLKESKLLITNSGGVDSVVLTHLCANLELNITLAHCNFKLRGAESDGDEQFVKDLGKDLEIDVFSKSFDAKEYAQKNKLSTQVAARDLRYEWFMELSKQHDFDYILTAHHADDDLETFFINLSRGTGIDGLTGIPAINGNIVRPMLDFTREQIEVYAIENELKWRDDSTNVSTIYLRNRLRHDVIPTLKNINKNLLQNFKVTQRQLKETKHIVDDRIEQISKDIIQENTDGTILFDIKKILELNKPKFYVYQLFKKYNFSELNDVFDLLTAQSGKYVYSQDYRLLKDREKLILSSLENNKSRLNITIENTDNEVEFPGGKLLIKEVSKIIFDKSDRIFIDAYKVEFPLSLRTRQKGDYFYPIGLGGKKKLSKYFKDEKYSLLDKERTWLLCSAENLIWVIPSRMDDRFKVTDNTKKIIEVTYVEG